VTIERVGPALGRVPAQVMAGADKASTCTYRWMSQPGCPPRPSSPSSSVSTCATSLAGLPLGRGWAGRPAAELGVTGGRRMCCCVAGVRVRSSGCRPTRSPTLWLATSVLRSGMTFFVEASVYLPTDMDARVEDIVATTGRSLQTAQPAAARRARAPDLTFAVAPRRASLTPACRIRPGFLLRPGCSEAVTAAPASLRRPRWSTRARSRGSRWPRSRRAPAARSSPPPTGAWRPGRRPPLPVERY